MATWVLASKLALELVARERVVPTLARRNGHIEARWAAALSASSDGSKVLALARCMPPAAHAVPVPDGGALDVWAPDALLRAFLDAVVDTFVRCANGGPEWEERWRTALQGPERSFEAQGFAERSVVDSLERWSNLTTLPGVSRPRLPVQCSRRTPVARS